MITDLALGAIYRPGLKFYSSVITSSVLTASWNMRLCVRPALIGPCSRRMSIVMVEGSEFMVSYTKPVPSLLFGVPIDW